MNTYIKLFIKICLKLEQGFSWTFNSGRKGTEGEGDIFSGKKLGFIDNSKRGSSVQGDFHTWYLYVIESYMSELETDQCTVIAEN